MKKYNFENIHLYREKFNKLYIKANNEINFNQEIIIYNLMKK